MSVWVLLHRLSWVLLIILVLVGTGRLLWPQVQQYQEMQRRKAALQEEIHLEQERLRALKAKQDQLQNDPRFVEKVAREEYGLARPGESVFKFVDEEPAAAPKRP
jgi:cell division protein FtsB